MELDGFSQLPEPASIPEARASATIVIARDGPGGLELFMLERHIQSEFAGGAFVFPGGTLDDGDLDTALAGLVDGWETLAEDMGEDDAELARALMVCAIRETFEEAGILLARTTEGAPVDLSGPRWSEWRAAVDAGEMSAAVLAKAAGIRYAADELRFWQRWVTPIHAPKRYDTRFFIARLPDGQVPLHDAVETTGSAWISPADALAKAEAGAFTIVFPTRKALESLAPFSSTDALLAAAVGRPNQPVLPRLLTRGAEVRIQVPPDETLQIPW